MPKIVMLTEVNCRSKDHKGGDKVARKSGDVVDASDHDAWYLTQKGVARYQDDMGPAKSQGLSTRNTPTVKGKKVSKKT